MLEKLKETLALAQSSYWKADTPNEETITVVLIKLAEILIEMEAERVRKD